MSKTVEDLLDTHSPQEVAPFANFIPVGLGHADVMEQRLGTAVKKYQQSLSNLVDLLGEDAPITVSNLSVQVDAWNEYYEASLEMMRMIIAEANTKRRAANKKITG